MLSKHIEQLERLEITENDKALRRTSSQGSTYMAHTHNDTGGRFSAISNPTVIGSEPIVRYPQLPASSPWAGPDLVPTEPPLGVDINEMDTTGQPHEIRASSLEPSTPPSAKAAPNPAPAQTPLTAGMGSSRTYRRA